MYPFLAKARSGTGALFSVPIDGDVDSGLVPKDVKMNLIIKVGINSLVWSILTHTYLRLVRGG
jgi:hypothetical protein